MGERGKLLEPLTKACAECPWRASNRGRRTSGSWYSLKNVRRLWAGLRSGEAPGMSCHPTDPENEASDEGKQAKPGADFRECYGSMLLVAREMRFLTEECSTDLKRYLKARPKALTKWGAMHWAQRFALGGVPVFGDGLAPMPKEWHEDADVQHPDFPAPPVRGK